MEPVLELKNITKSFSGVPVLKGVSFTVYQGEVVGLVGENGAGKSTLMKIITGIHRPDSGEFAVHYNEQDGSKLHRTTFFSSVRESIDAGIGLIHQELNVFDNLDVAANIFLGREPRKMGFLDRKKMYEDSLPFLRAVGLNVSPDTLVSRLTLAQQQLVEICKALSLNARVLIMDEPTSSLTLTETQRLLALIGELKEKGVSIIYITHRLGELMQCADRVVGLRDGINSGELTRDNLSHDGMVHLMVGRNIAPGEPERGQENTEPVLCVKNLTSERFPGSSVSLDVRQGEIFTIAGLMGSGRTEIMEALFGVRAKGKANIELNGKQINIGSPADAIRNGIYLVTEDRRNSGLVLTNSIRENITLPSLPRFAKWKLVSKAAESKAAQKQREDLLIKTASLETPAVNLSGGNQQKVVLGKWLAMEPKVMIFDEPTRGVDVNAKAEIYRLMRELAEQGVIILTISSDMEEVLKISTRIAVMHEGVIRGILSGDDRTEENIMKLAVGAEGAAVA